MPKSMVMRFELFTYDLWIDSEGGASVNDVYRQGEIELVVKPAIMNKGTDAEFVSYEPTDLQLNRAIGARGVEWEGDAEHILYGNSKKNGNPVCELRRIKE